MARNGFEFGSYRNTANRYEGNAFVAVFSAGEVIWMEVSSSNAEGQRWWLQSFT